MEQSVEDMMMIAAGVLFLILGIALLIGITNKLGGGSAQLALASTKRLAGAIRESCLTEHDVPIELSMQQNKGMTTSIAGWPITIGSQMRIRTVGDPDFVLYYEMFPPGEAISWELYHDFEPHAITVLPDGYDGKDLSALEDFIKKSDDTALEKLAKEDPSKNIAHVPVLVANIELNPDMDPTTGKKIGQNDKEGFFGLGEWLDLQTGERIFRFTNYIALSEMNKTLVKYVACGPNSLCLKTPQGVYTFALPECAGKIIDVRYKRTSYTNLEQPVEQAYAKRDADLSLASPCKMSANVKYVNCDCEQGKFVKSPMYTYDVTDEKLKTSKDTYGNTIYHYQCVGTDINGGDSLPKTNGKCIEIEFNSKEGHCYTYNAEDDVNMLDKIRIAMVSAGRPVKDSTEYYNGVYILKQKQKAKDWVVFANNVLQGIGGNAADEWWWP